jgi:hypothetical protein
MPMRVGQQLERMEVLGVDDGVVWLVATALDATGLHQARVDRIAKLGEADTKVRDAQGNESALPTRQLHVLAAEDGTYPVTLNGWELQVLDAEAARAGFLGWYRNPGRASKESLAVAYREASTGDWKAMRPDFLFFFATPDGKVAVDLVDPHGHHLADALPKLCGLAEFAEQFPTEFRRVESIAETDGKLRVLDLTRDDVRHAIRQATDAKALYRSGVAADY